MNVCHTISFCVLWIYGINICHDMPYFFVCNKVFEILNSHACVCVLNNLLLTYSYDYNINSHLEKGDT
jgi:hypothetical protein